MQNTEQWWRLVRSYPESEIFACKTCFQSVVVRNEDNPLPDECPNCETRTHTEGLYKSGEILRKERDEALSLLKQARKDSKELKKHQKDSLQFVGHVYQFISWLDAEMKKPSDQDRGKRVAHALNALEMSADRFSHFTLDQSFESIAKLKGKKP